MKNFSLFIWKFPELFLSLQRQIIVTASKKGFGDAACDGWLFSFKSLGLNSN